MLVSNGALLPFFSEIKLKGSVFSMKEMIRKNIIMIIKMGTTMEEYIHEFKRIWLYTRDVE